MERRLCKRYSVELETIISFPALGLIHAQVRNIGPDGLYIDTGNVSLDIGSCVELVLLGVGKLPQVYRLNATVVFSNDRGAGMLFSKENSLNNQEFQEMIKILLMSEVTGKFVADSEHYCELKSSDVTRGVRRHLLHFRSAQR